MHYSWIFNLFYLHRSRHFCFKFYLFVEMQESWTNASKKQREKLLELIRRLAEDDKEGVMAHKVKRFFYDLVNSSF